MSNKIIVAKSGYSALTETDLNNIAFHSDYNTLKYYSQGTTTVTVNKADYYYTNPGSPPFVPTTYYNYKVGEISHDLGYIPYFVGYISLSGTEACQAPFAYGDAFFFLYESVYADSNKLYFVVHFNSTDNSGLEEFDFSYRIFRNNLGL